MLTSKHWLSEMPHPLSDDRQCKASMLVSLKRPLALTQAPSTSPQLEGRWRLLFTSKPGTASPIQRSFTGVDAFSIFQVPL